MHDEKPFKSKLICPKCGNNNLEIEEHWIAYIGFSQENGIISYDLGVKEYGGAFKLIATYNNNSCNHCWKVRNCTQITDLKKQ